VPLPFSPVSVDRPGYEHEEMSIEMLRYLIAENELHYQYREEDIQLIRSVYREE
jgi:hypothetical protein